MLRAATCGNKPKETNPELRMAKKGNQKNRVHDVGISYSSTASDHKGPGSPMKLLHFCVNPTICDVQVETT